MHRRLDIQLRVSTMESQSWYIMKPWLDRTFYQCFFFCMTFNHHICAKHTACTRLVNDIHRYTLYGMQAQHFQHSGVAQSHSTDVSGTAMTHPHTPLPPQTAGTSCRIAAEILIMRSRLFFPPQIPCSAFFTAGTGRWCASNLIYNQIHGVLNEESAAAGCGLERKQSIGLIIWLLHD